MLNFLPAPLVGVIPAAATAPALILVGALMLAHASEIDWHEPKIAIPAFLTLTAIPKRLVVIGGGLSMIAYGIAIWAMTKAPVALVASLRETSVLFATLIGARLVRILDGVKLVGIIIETEGYIGEDDQACHAKAGWAKGESTAAADGLWQALEDNHRFNCLLWDEEDLARAGGVKATDRVEVAPMIGATANGRLMQKAIAIAGLERDARRVARLRVPVLILGERGTGKTTLCKQITASVPGIWHSVSYTTRQPRPGEEHGREYFFIEEKIFQDMVAKNEFMEYAHVYGNWYGTPRKALMDKMEQGIDVLLEIDWQGAQQVRSLFPQAIGVFILPPSMETLRTRLQSRASDTPEEIQRRLQKVKEEVWSYREYYYIVRNDNLEQSLKELQSVFLAEVEDDDAPVPRSQVDEVVVRADAGQFEHRPRHRWRRGDERHVGVERLREQTSIAVGASPRPRSRQSIQARYVDCGPGGASVLPPSTSRVVPERSAAFPRSSTRPVALEVSADPERVAPMLGEILLLAHREGPRRPRDGR